MKTIKLWHSPRQYVWKHLRQMEWSKDNGTTVSFSRIHVKLRHLWFSTPFIFIGVVFPQKIPFFFSQCVPLMRSTNKLIIIVLYTHNTQYTGLTLCHKTRFNSTKMLKDWYCSTKSVYLQFLGSCSCSWPLWGWPGVWRRCWGKCKNLVGGSDLKTEQAVVKIWSESEQCMTH